MSAVIEAAGLGKSFRIVHQQEARYSTLRDTVSDALRGLSKRNSARAEEIFWALKDIDFEIRAGERVGIIGANGAGKSTLLKLLSRITSPSRGRMVLRGRVASLLEVGTGFHPELTGRENIFLNGAILGMGRREIRARFDQIVDFAQVERFLDTPVKRYSSGMYTRLAFAVAAHLDSDILIVDEVLAVGDAEFQRRCLSHMRSVGLQGRTVLFVSHNLEMVQSLCDRALLLDSGKLGMDGAAAAVVDSYVGGMQAGGGVNLVLQQKRQQPHLGQRVRVAEVRLLNGAGEPTNQLALGESFSVQVNILASAPQGAISLMVGVDTSDNNRLVSAFSQQARFDFNIDTDENRWVEASFEQTLLFPGKYYLNVALRSGQQGLDLVRQCLLFQVLPGTHARIETAPGLYGQIGAFVDWRLLPSAEATS